MNVLCFGIAKDIIGTASLEIAAEAPTTVEDLKKYLVQTYPKFKEFTTFKVAVNQAFADGEQSISPSDEIAIIPPVSGG